MATEGLGVRTTPFINQSTTFHVPPGTLSHGRPYTNGDKGVVDMGQSVIKGPLISRRDKVFKMPAAQVQLSQTPSTVQKTAQKVSKLSLVWSALWRTVVGLPAFGIGGLIWGIMHCKNEIQRVNNDPTNQLIRSLETPVQKTFSVGSAKEGNFDRDGSPLMKSGIEGSTKSAQLKDGTQLHLLSQFHSSMENQFTQYQLYDMDGKKIEGSMEEKAAILAKWSGQSIQDAFDKPDLSNPMSVIQSLLSQQLSNPMTSVEMGLMTQTYMKAMDEGISPQTAPYETDPKEVVVQLLPDKKVQATAKLKVNFADGESNTYLFSQHMKIHPGKQGKPCQVEMTRSINPTQE